MTIKTDRSKQAITIRWFRKIHRITASLLFLFFFIMASTGLLLGLKKHSGGVLLSKSYSGVSNNLKSWLTIDSLYTNATMVFRDSISETLPLDVDRIEIHKEKGMVKFIFLKGFWGIQLDATTGELLHIERRRADFVEKVHDGSILDYYLSTTNGQIKLVYTVIMGLSLLLFTITGFWLWYGPKRMRKNKSITKT
ncbi:MAG: DNA mismatch repair protein [Bacteroidetes bacterium HGW-Bacteroidetes-15]|nr:MAG: DNA mismatch repair protein [Bacteroidetes bacterium HGW-Bacteroidetes-15]